MKRWYMFFFSLLVFLCLAIPTLAIENNVGGNVKVAGMGFTQVSNNSSFIANPASFEESKIFITAANTELFGSGVIYNYLEGGFRFRTNWNLNFGFESVIDKDKIDNSGYSQKMLTIGVAKKIRDRFQLGFNISQTGYGLFEEVTGNGIALNLGVFYSPFFILGNNETGISFKIDNLVARREYKTDRNEIPKTGFTLGLNLRNNNYVYVMDVKSGDFRCGVEYCILPSLFLRGGINNGEPTLGVGVIQGPIRIDYAYWLSELGATHRIGSSISF